MNILASFSILPLLLVSFFASAGAHKINEKEFLNLRKQTLTMESIDLAGSNGMVLETLIDQRTIDQQKSDKAASVARPSGLGHLFKMAIQNDQPETKLPEPHESIGFFRIFVSPQLGGSCKLTVNGPTHHGSLACHGKFIVNGSEEKLGFRARLVRISDTAATFKTDKGTLFHVFLKKSNSSEVSEYVDGYDILESSVP